LGKGSTKLFFYLLIAVLLTPFGGKAALPDTIPAAQNEVGPDRKRLTLVAGGQLVGYTGALIALDQAWYKDYPKSSFHFHNDLPDWLQQDKLGHLTANYHLSRLSSSTFAWAGLDNRRSAWYGALSGFGFLTAVEFLDGFSAEWGASLSDMGANMLGAGTFLTQQLFWEEQRIGIKYSYSNSGLAQYRPNLLGSTLPEHMLKDYNGQTFWLSFNLKSVFAPQSRMPAWLNLAVGHGANGMLGSRENPEYNNGQELPQIVRYRQWYLAPDIDFSRIPVQNPLLKTFLSTLNFLKMPAPAIEYNIEKGWVFHWVFF
jgi:hypothetical protein